MSISEVRRIEPARRPLSGSVRVPGSKSVSNRAILLAALARGRSRLTGLLRADDTDAMLAAIETLGIRVDRDGDTIEIEGAAGRFPGGGTIECGHGGTPARFLLAAACLADEPVTIDGSPRLRERPMQELVQFLRQLGSHVESIEGNDRLPIRIEPGPIRGGTLHVGPTASSQFISALMLISPFLEEGLSLEFDGAITSAGYVMLTAHELEAWGIGVEVETRDGDITSVRIRPGMIASREQEIAPDASSAVYWAVASALIPGSNIELAGLQLDDPQPDIGVLRALQQNGVEIKEGTDGIVVCAPKTLRGWPALDASRMPDGAVALSVLAACSVSNSTMSGLETLRIKESDRIGALKAELERCGAVVRTTKDSIGITPIPQSLLSEDAPEVEIKTYDDHRMAMAFSILGLRRGGLSIQDPGCTSKSYPRFFEDLSRVVG